MSKVTRAPSPLFFKKQHIYLKKDIGLPKSQRMQYSCLLVTTWRMLTGCPDGSIPLFIALQFGNQSRINRPQVNKQQDCRKLFKCF